MAEAASTVVYFQPPKLLRFDVDGEKNAERKMNPKVSPGVSLIEDTSTWQK